MKGKFGRKKMKVNDERKKIKVKRLKEDIEKKKKKGRYWKEEVESKKMKERRSFSNKLNEIKDKVSNMTFWLIHMISKLVTAEFMLHNSMNKHLAQSVIPLITSSIQGVPKNMGIQWRIEYRLCYELAL